MIWVEKMHSSEEQVAVDPMLEKIWDLHDKLSDAILSVSRSHYHLSSAVRSDDVSLPRKRTSDREGFVFVKEFRFPEYYVAAVNEAKSLNGIRAALENLEDQLEFFHTVQVQQRAERDAAIARLEQSRIFLAKRLSEHHGKKYKVIEEALAFVGDTSQFLSPPGEISVTHKGIGFNFIKVIVSSFDFAKRSLKINEIGGILGNATLVAFSMLALLHIHQTSSKRKYVFGLPHENAFYNKNLRRNYKSEDSLLSDRLDHLDVTLARG